MVHFPWEQHAYPLFAFPSPYCGAEGIPSAFHDSQPTASTVILGQGYISGIPIHGEKITKILQVRVPVHLLQTCFNKNWDIYSAHHNQPSKFFWILADRSNILRKNTPMSSERYNHFWNLMMINIILLIHANYQQYCNAYSLFAFPSVC